MSLLVGPATLRNPRGSRMRVAVPHGVSRHSRRGPAFTSSSLSRFGLVVAAQLLVLADAGGRVCDQVPPESVLQTSPTSRRSDRRRSVRAADDRRVAGFRTESSDRLIKIASRILGYEMTGKKADFFNFRHSGASHMAMRGNRPKDLMSVVRMMGDTSLTTVNRHYFNIDDEMLAEIVEGWSVPELPALHRRGHADVAEL